MYYNTNIYKLQFVFLNPAK